MILLALGRRPTEDVEEVGGEQGGSATARGGDARRDGDGAEERAERRRGDDVGFRGGGEGAQRGALLQKE